MPERGLGVDEHLVPEVRLLVRLELRQVEVRAAAGVDGRLARVEQVHPEIEQRGRDRRAVHEHVRLDEVPAARADHERGAVVGQAVRLAVGRIEGQDAARRVGDRGLAGDEVGPGRRQRVLEVGHEDPGPRVERVDHHLGLGRAGDLDPPVLQVGRGRRHGPRRLTDVATGREEVGPDAGIDVGLALLPLPEQLEADRAEATLQVRDEGEDILGQDPVPVRDDGSLQLDADGQVHASPRRTVASIRPCGSVVAM